MSPWLIYVCYLLPGPCHLPFFVFPTLPFLLPGGQVQGLWRQLTVRKSWLWREGGIWAVFTNLLDRQGKEAEHSIEREGMHKPTHSSFPTVLCPSMLSRYESLKGMEGGEGGMPGPVPRAL